MAVNVCTYNILKYIQLRLRNKNNYIKKQQSKESQNYILYYVDQSSTLSSTYLLKIC